MTNQMENKQMKLVRVVLFLDWQDRKNWKDCLEGTAEECTKKGWKEYTGQFPSYTFRDNPDMKLFGKYEIWRFIEVAKLKDEDKSEVLIDSYVYFCQNMERVEKFFEINRFEFIENEKVFDGGFNCKYKNGILRGIPLPFPKALMENLPSKKQTCCRVKTYVRFHHGQHTSDFRYSKDWNVTFDWPGGDFIYWFDFQKKLFSSIPFLRYLYNMAKRKLILLAPNNGPHNNPNHGFPSELRSLDNNEDYQLRYCTNGCIPNDVQQPLANTDVVYVHQDANTDIQPNHNGLARLKYIARPCCASPRQGTVIRKGLVSSLSAWWNRMIDFPTEDNYVQLLSLLNSWETLRSQDNQYKI